MMLRPTKYSAVTGLVGLLALGSAAGGSAFAGEATYLSADAGPCEIFRVLSHDVPGECRLAAGASTALKTRSIRFHDDPVVAEPAVQSIAMTAAEPVIDEEEDAEPLEIEGDLSLAMRIQFQLNSDVLTDLAKTSLDSIATVLNNELMADKVVLLEGHADATGTEAYNLDLSQRRAEAVQQYLVDQHEIEQWRLPFAGKGEAELYDGAAPTASINRRVEFTNITG